MNIKHIEALINPKTAAIMAVHIYGLPVDMDPILNIALKNLGFMLLKMPQN